MTVGTAAMAAPTRTQRLRQIAAMRMRTTAVFERLGLDRAAFAAMDLRPGYRSQAAGPLSSVTVFHADTKAARRARRTVLNRNNPVTAQVERQLLVKPIDERRAVLVQERYEADRPF